MSLVLVRHGESAANAEGIWCGGGLDSPLTETGEDQALNCGEELRDIDFAAVYCSPLRRSRDTADTIMQRNRLGLPEGGDIQVKHELLERHNGIITGMTNAEALTLFPRRKWLEWERDYFKAPPGGESLYDTAERVLPFVQNEVIPLIRRDLNVLIVSHSDVMKVIFGYLKGIEENEVPRIKIQHAIPYFFHPRGV